MKDDLHELIDGGLPDEQAAELLHLLSVDPEKRTMFTQQMRLQKTLCRNDRHAGLSAFEEGEMLDRISRSVGESPSGAGRMARRGIAMVALGFLVGAGAGYAGRDIVAPARQAADTVRVIQHVPVPTPQVVNIDRDSIVRAVRDSITRAQKAAAATTTTKRATAKVTPKKKSTSSGSTNDLTGRPQVVKKKRR